MKTHTHTQKNIPRQNSKKISKNANHKINKKHKILCKRKTKIAKQIRKKINELKKQYAKHNSKYFTPTINICLLALNHKTKR